MVARTNLLQILGGIALTIALDIVFAAFCDMLWFFYQLLNHDRIILAAGIGIAIGGVILTIACISTIVSMIKERSDADNTKEE
jgi:membrane-bound metal-dependent hydrolase YbcI (DUF457 family)